MSEDIRALVATASRILAAAGQGDLIWGHASARDPDGHGVWLKSARWGLEEVIPERVHLVSEDGQVLEGDGSRHSEYPIHTEVMIARPDVGGVVHTHPPHAVALAATGQPLRPVSHAANYFVPPDVPRFTGTGDLILTQDLGREVAAALGSASAIFLVNHGIVTVGPDLQTATVAAVLLERACAQQMLTHAFGGWPSWSGPGESRSKRRNIYADGPVRAVWEYLERSLSPPPPLDGGSSTCSLRLVGAGYGWMSRRSGHRAAWLPFPARRMRPSTASWKARFQRWATSGRNMATGRPVNASVLLTRVPPAGSGVKLHR